MSENQDDTSAKQADHVGTQSESATATALAIDERGYANWHRLERAWLTADRTSAMFGDTDIASVHGATIRNRLRKATPPPPVVYEGGYRSAAHFHTHDSFDAVGDLALLDSLERHVDKTGTIILEAKHFDPKKPHPEDTATLADVGKKFATLPKIAASLKVSKTVVVNRLGDAKRMKVRIHTGQKSFVYDMAAIGSIVREEVVKPRENKAVVTIDENGFYEEKEGEKVIRWCTTDAFYAGLSPEVKAKTSEEAIRRRAARSCKSRDAIDRIGRAGCKIFLFTDLQSLSILSQERTVGPDGIYLDTKTKKQWASLSTWQDVFRVSAKSLTDQIEETFGEIKDMEKLKVFNSAKREDEMFSRDQIEEALSALFDNENLEINGVITHLEEVAGATREAIYVTGPELAEIIPPDRVARYMFYRKLGETQIDAKNRVKAGVQPALSLQAAIATFHSQIADLLAAIEKTDANDEVHAPEGRYITISKFLNERRASDAKVSLRRDVDRGDRPPCRAGPLGHSLLLGCEANDNIENPRRFIANTDQAQRIRRMNSQNELTYLYLESDLQKAQLALKAA